MRALALDIGDVWTGVAISDPLGITARPYTTLKFDNLFADLAAIVTKEKVSRIIIGYPQTVRGTESDQTKKVLVIADQIAAQFPQITCTLLDERFTSQQAARLKKATSKEAKLEQHAVAAALILKSFLDHMHFEAQDTNVHD